MINDEMTPPDEAIVVDARGHRCPTPTLRLRRAMAAAAPGALIRLLADDPMARIDVPHFAAEAGARVLAMSDADGWLQFTVETPAAPAD